MRIKIKKVKKKEENARPLQMNYCSPRWSGEITDCSMPMTFDQYDHCSFNCLYCFSWFQKALKALNPLFPNEYGKNYQQNPVRSVNPSSMKKLFDLGYGQQGQKGQFYEYIKQKIAMQWGGLCDPFDGYERQYGIGLKILKDLKRHHYPICFSTKSTWWTEDDRYMRLFTGEDQWNTKFSIINLDPDLAAKIEKGVPSPADRLKAMKRLHKINPDGGVTLRLRPFIIGMSDKDYIDLIKQAHEAGASAVSTEFFCLEDRAHRGTISRYEAMSEALGFDIRQYYKINSPGMCGYLRLNYKLKEPYIVKMRDLCHKLGMRFYVSDAHWKDQCDGGSCCGLPERFNYSRAQYTELLQLAKSRPDGRVYWHDMGQHIEQYKNFRYIYAEGFNTVGSRKRTMRWNDTMYDYLLSIWNKPNDAKSPYKYFSGLLWPVDHDEDGNVVYEYRPYKK